MKTKKTIEQLQAEYQHGEALIKAAPPIEQSGALYEYLLGLDDEGRMLILNVALTIAHDFKAYRPIWQEGVKRNAHWIYVDAVRFMRSFWQAIGVAAMEGIIKEILDTVPTLREHKGKIRANLRSVPR